MRKPAAVLLVLASILALTSGCASVDKQQVSIKFEGGGKMNLTQVDWGVQKHGGSVDKHYVAEILPKEGGQQIDVYAESSEVGTAQQVAGNLALSVPGAVSNAVVGLDQNKTWRANTKTAAKAAAQAAENAPSPTYVDDKDTLVYNYTGVNTKVDLCLKEGIGCGGP